MNILRVIDSMDPKYGGPCQGIRNIVPVLESLGVHNEVVCLDSPDAAFLGKDSFPVYALGPAVGPWHYSRNLVPWLEEHLDRFDAVIIHGLWLYYGHATSRTVRRYREQNSKRLKLFVMPHGMLDPYFQRAPDRKLKAIRNSLYWKLIEKDVVNKADGVFFTCEAELLLAREPFRPYAPKKEVNVKYGIKAPPEYTREMKETFLKRCPEVANKPYFLFLSRIHEKKGVDILINSYLKTAKENTPKLVIAGPGLDTAYGSKMKDIVSRSAFKDSIFFPGMLAGDEKWGAFYGSEAFVLPSHQENFGIAVVEALACGRPVLISNMVNIWREIEAEGGGIVAEDTAEGTMNLFERWATLSGEEKAAMRDGARRAFTKNFHVLNVAQYVVEALKG